MAYKFYDKIQFWREFPNSLSLAFCLVGHHTCRRMDGAYMILGGHVTDHVPYTNISDLAYKTSSCDLVIVVTIICIFALST